jgi:hypothetical protein
MLLEHSIGIAPPDQSNLLTPPNSSDITGIFFKGRKISPIDAAKNFIIGKSPKLKETKIALEVR